MHLKFKNVSYRYETLGGAATNAITDLTLDLSQTTMTAIVGHTGSGKSTAMQHLNGLLQPTSGSVEVDQEIITNKKHKRLYHIRQKIGYVFQNPAYQLFAATVLEDVMYGPLNFGYDKQQAQQMAVAALEMVELSADLYERYPFELSGGQMRKVALAGALAYNPEVLILDEPTVGLDPLAIQHMSDLFSKLQRQHDKQLLFITHDMEFVQQLAQRVVVFFEGQIVFDATPHQLFMNQSVQQQYALESPVFYQLLHSLEQAGIYDIPQQAETLTMTDLLQVLEKRKGDKV